jgi:hypothetical protein
MANAEVKRFADKSSIEFKRLAGERVRMTARFVYKSARYEVEGVIDTAKQRAEPFKHRFSLGGQRVFESTIAVGVGVSQTEFKFGPATRGARRLLLKSEALARGAVTTGIADGIELLPLISGGCSCKHAVDESRPILGWQGGAAKPVTVSLKSTRGIDDVGGLAEVAETTIARTNNGFFGDLIGCIQYGLCLLLCGIEYLVCVGGTAGLPRRDIFVGLCSVTGGACVTLCKFENSFPS